MGAGELFPGSVQGGCGQILNLRHNISFYAYLCIGSIIPKSFFGSNMKEFSCGLAMKKFVLKTSACYMWEHTL